MKTCVSYAPRRDCTALERNPIFPSHRCRALHTHKRSRSKGSLHSRLVGQVSPVRGSSIVPLTNKEGGQIQRERTPDSEEPKDEGWSPVLCEMIAIIIMAP